MPYTLTERGLSLIVRGRPTLIPRSHPKWESIVACLHDPTEIDKILNPTGRFEVGQEWRTRAGGYAKIIMINRKTGVITVDVDDMYEMDLILGEVVPGEQLPEDLMHEA